MTVITISSSQRPVRNYFAQLKEVLFEPAHFFRLLAPQHSTAEALTFGLVSIWISAIISFFWSITNSMLLQKLLEFWVEDSDASFRVMSGQELVWQAGYVIATPFLSLLGLAISALVLLGFSKLFISDEPAAVMHELQVERESNLTYTQTLKIVGFASAGTWLSIVPIFGPLLSYFAILLLTMIGVRESFRVSTKRAALVVFVPQFIFILFFLLFAAFIIFLFALLPWDQIMDLQSLEEGDLDACLRLISRGIHFLSDVF